MRYPTGVACVLLLAALLAAGVGIGAPPPSAAQGPGPCASGPPSLGIISSDTSWCREFSPYTLPIDARLESSATLTIQPGVVVRMSTQTSLTIHGTLRAIGTAAEPIVFTSLTSSGTRGAWDQLFFSSTSIDSLLDHVTVEYGGDNPTTMILLRSDAVTIRNSIIRGSEVNGLWIDAVDPTISNTRLEDNTLSPIVLEQGAQPALGGLQVQGNGFDAISVDGAIVSTPYHWGDGGIRTYRLLADVRVDAALTIAPGTTVRLASQVALNVNGTLTAIGTAAEPIVFTSLTSSGTRGAWDELFFGSTSIDSLLDYVTVEYGGVNAGAAIDIRSSAVMIRNSTVSQSDGDGIAVRTGSPTISRTNLVDNAGAGLRNTGGGLVSATCNWWGAASGPQNAGNPSGAGQAAVGAISFEPWLVAPGPGGECSGTRRTLLYLPLLSRSRA